MLTVKAGDLADALKPAKPHPLKKEAEARSCNAGARLCFPRLFRNRSCHGAFSKSIAASGDWPNPVQVEGLLLLQSRQNGQRKPN